MATQLLINKLLNIVKLAQVPKPLDCIILANSIIEIDDPFSDLLLKLSKNHLEITQKIFCNIKNEGNMQGALQRALVHIETAKKCAIDYYTNKMNNTIINLIVLWCDTKEAELLEKDVVKLIFYQLMCHKLLGSKTELMKSLILEMPRTAYCGLVDYKYPISNFFGKEWNALYKPLTIECIKESLKQENRTLVEIFFRVLDFLFGM